MAESIEALVAALARELVGQQTPSGENAGLPKSPSKPKEDPSVETRYTVVDHPIGTRYTVADYPMLEKHGDAIRTPTGKSMKEITLENVLDGSIKIQDVRISPEMLEAQAEIAADAGKPAMGENLRRAAELTRVPDDEVIRMYDMLRPNRSSRAQLEELAVALESQYAAPLCAALVREAGEVYEKRGILK